MKPIDQAYEEYLARHRPDKDTRPCTDVRLRTAFYAGYSDGVADENRRIAFLVGHIIILQNNKWVKINEII